MRKEDIRSAYSQVRAPGPLYDKILQGAKPRYSLRPGLVIAYTLFVGTLCFVLGGAALNNSLWETDLTVDYTMQAAVITADGKVTETFQITVQGNIYGAKDKHSKMELSILMPNSFRYRYVVPKEGAFTSISGINDELPYYVWMGYGYDTVTNRPVMGSYAMSVEKEILIMDWDDGQDLYLAATTDPNADFAAILDYFEDYLGLYSFSDHSMIGKAN